jgi:hypothetical protein
VLIGLTFLLTSLLSAPCTPTPIENLLNDIIAPARGADPAWLVDGWDGRGKAARDTPIKTLWVFKTAGPVRVQGRELKTGAKARFQHEGMDGPTREEMVIDNPRRDSVRPFGASPETLSAYSFIPSEVFYPEAGCYQFDIEIDRTRRRIVLEVR